MSSNFDYREINALFIQKIIEKIEELVILMHSCSVTLRFKFVKNFISTALKELEDWNEINKLIKQWLIDKRKNIIVKMIVKYENKSKRKFLNLFEKIKFLSKTSVLTSDNCYDPVYILLAWV